MSVCGHDLKGKSVMQELTLKAVPYQVRYISWPQNDDDTKASVGNEALRSKTYSHAGNVATLIYQKNPNFQPLETINRTSLGIRVSWDKFSREKYILQGELPLQRPKNIRILSLKRTTAVEMKQFHRNVCQDEAREVKIRKNSKYENLSSELSSQSQPYQRSFDP